MEKLSIHTEEEKFDAQINEKRVTKNYIEKRNPDRKRRPKRRDTHHRRKKLILDDPDTKASSKDFKLASLSTNSTHNIVINWLLMGSSSHIFK
jgi:hypothetical protein